MTNCKVCTGDFKTSPDDMVLCEHKEGSVHLGCCVYDCSLDRKPCVHALGVYKKHKQE